MELPHSGTLRGSGAWALMKSSVWRPASSRVTADAVMASSSPLLVCIRRTTSSMASSASGGAFTTTSGPSATIWRLSSVTRVAISTMRWRLGSSPVISRSIHTSTVEAYGLRPTIRDVPELPEVESLARFLAEQSGGRTIEKVELAAIAALKTFDPPLDALVGRTVVGADRRGKFLGLDTDGMWLALHLARGGWVRWSDSLSPGPVKRGKGPLALRVRFEGGAGFDVTEAGTEKRLAVYVVRSLDEVPGIARLGPDVLDPSFDAAALGKVLAEHGSQQVKGVLTEQVAIAGVGNAYSDEALFVAKLSPFRQAGKL